MFLSIPRPVPILEPTTRVPLPPYVAVVRKAIIAYSSLVGEIAPSVLRAEATMATEGNFKAGARRKIPREKAT